MPLIDKPLPELFEYRGRNPRPADFDAALTAYILCLRKFAKRHVPHDKIDEIMQITLTQAIVRWQAYREEEGTFATWMQWQMRSALAHERQKARRLMRTGRNVNFDAVSTLAIPQLVTPPRQEDIVDAKKALAAIADSELLMRIAFGDSAAEIAKAKGIKRAMPLAVSAPFHSPLMKPAANRMAEELAKVTIRPLAAPVLANVTAAEANDPETVRRLLVEQVTGRVRWRESILALKSLGVETTVEFGGKVLTGMVKRIDPSLTMIALETPANLEAFGKSL